MSYFTPHLDKYLLKAELKIAVFSSEMTTDSVGNPIPKTDCQVLTCYLKEVATPQEQTMGGVDTHRTYFRGYLTSPKVYPPDISPPFECAATIDKKQGKFFVDPHTPQPWETNTGIKISGYFVRQ